MMRKWLLLLIVFLLMGVIYNRLSGSGPQKDELVIRVEKNQVHEGNLLLVNEELAVPPNHADAEAVNLYKHKELLNGFGLLDSTVRLSPDLTKKFASMIADAANDGVDHFLINSGYRNNKEQEALYEELGPEIAAVPGHSEHNLGLALDIGSTTAQMKDAPEGKWLKENSWKYGFIVRYPEDKTNITDVVHEPWHFRYVGLPHSVIMHENHFAFEEYLDYLKESKSITMVVAGNTYVIYYYPISSNTTLHVPTKGSYEISGNNSDGVIVTVMKSQD
ncbi:M15 family metallopeptidase [Paenibacillus glycanilyticus]|uniref:M15 family metallopeptidase n=1 Tax=Paenibacillus glycanilyticus TaxID=126569 RepID=UPI00203AFC99|nr:M15 family metallopeptidase [Paenibacillus glycanilyticus]MCM3628218.1 M15 family metallopeptidase [Paenibacillus glycanilyticus]